MLCPGKAMSSNAIRAMPKKKAAIAQIAGVCKCAHFSIDSGKMSTSDTYTITPDESPKAAETKRRPPVPGKNANNDPMPVAMAVNSVRLRAVTTVLSKKTAVIINLLELIKSISRRS